MPFITRKTLENRFYVSALVGEGPLALVYRARELSPQRMVALKNFRPRNVRTRAALEKISAPARAASDLHHPHIAQIYELFETDGQFALVQEWMPRGNLARENLDAAQFTFEQTLTLLDQCLDALAAAHINGIVHGNLKPTNLLLDETNSIKLTDFGLGLSGIAQQHSVRSPLLAPELFEGAMPSAQSDLYALGMIWQQIFLQRQDAWGSTFHFAAAAPQDVYSPEPVARIRFLIARATAAAPEARFISAYEMRAALYEAQTQTLLDGAPRPAHPRPPTKRITITVLKPEPVLDAGAPTPAIESVTARDALAEPQSIETETRAPEIEPVHTLLAEPNTTGAIVLDTSANARAEILPPAPARAIPAAAPRAETVRDARRLWIGGAIAFGIVLVTLAVFLWNAREQIAAPPPQNNSAQNTFSATATALAAAAVRVTQTPTAEIFSTPTPAFTATPAQTDTPAPVRYADVKLFAPITENARCQYETTDANVLRIRGSGNKNVCASVLAQEYTNGAMLVNVERIRGDGFGGGSSVIVFGYQSPQDFFGVVLTRTGRLYTVAHWVNGTPKSLGAYNWSESLNRTDDNGTVADQLLLQIQNNRLTLAANGKVLDSIALEGQGYSKGRFGVGVLGGDALITESAFSQIVVGALQ